VGCRRLTGKRRQTARQILSRHWGKKVGGVSRTKEGKVTTLSGMINGGEGGGGVLQKQVPGKKRIIRLKREREKGTISSWTNVKGLEKCGNNIHTKGFTKCRGEPVHIVGRSRANG